MNFTRTSSRASPYSYLFSCCRVKMTGSRWTTCWRGVKCGATERRASREKNLDGRTVNHRAVRLQPDLSEGRPAQQLAERQRGERLKRRERAGRDSAADRAPDAVEGRRPCARLHAHRHRRPAGEAL